MTTLDHTPLPTTTQGHGFTAAMIARFWRRVQITPGCWLWTGTRHVNGYGRVIVRRREIGAHTFAYRLLVGPIPPGLVIDHVRKRGCTNRHCVNPAHLEPVTRGENVLRGDSPFALNARKTHCIRGHEFTPENTVTRRGGGRICVACDRARWRARDPEREAQRLREYHARKKLSPG